MLRLMRILTSSRCSLLACLITILAGAYAFWDSGESRDTQFSSIGRAMQSSDIAALFAQESTYSRDLQRKVASTKIQLHRDGRLERFRVSSDSVRLNSM